MTAATFHLSANPVEAHKTLAGSVDRLRQHLLDVFNYEPDSGQLTRKTSESHNAMSGSAVGWVNAAGYKCVNVLGKTYLVHRVIWLMVYGEFPSGVIDHIDQNKVNNKIANLRDVSRQINSQNTRATKKGKKYGVLAGATLEKKSGRWKSSICINGTQKHLGRFATEQEAHEAYLRAKRSAHAGCTL